MYNRSLYSTIATLVAFLISPSLFATEKANNTIVITANRTAQNIDDVLADVQVITRDDIDRVQPESVVDILRNIVGFDIVQSGGAGQTSSLFTRGTSSDHTLVLVDGIRVGSATVGNKSFSDIPVAQIERIEIVKGPRASLWGSDAIGGVIQIFTRQLSHDEYSVVATLGDDRFASTNFSFGFGSEKISNTVTFSYEKSDGFDVVNDSTDTLPNSEPDDDGYQRLSAAIRGDYEISNETNLDWVFQYDDGENSFDNSFGANENEYNNHLWNIRYTYSIDKWTTQFSINQSRDKAFSFDSRVATKVGSIFETRRNQINFLTHYKHSEAFNLSLGGEHFNDNIGRSRVQQFDGSFAEFPESERDTDAIFISSIFKLGNIISEISVRHDDIERVDTNQTFNLSAGYKILDNITIAASRAKGFKAPTFSDLYFPGFSNPDLVHEISFNNELLVKANWEHHSFMFVSFENEVDQLIAYDPVRFNSFNIDRANLKGYEFVYQFKQDRFTHKLTASHVDAVDKSIDITTGNPRNEQLLRRAKEFYGYELIADIGDFSLFAQLNYAGRRRDNDFSTFPATAVYLPSHIGYNLGASYRVNQQLGFKLRVSDYDEPTVFSYNAIGKQIFLTAEYRNF